MSDVVAVRRFGIPLSVLMVFSLVLLLPAGAGLTVHDGDRWSLDGPNTSDIIWRQNYTFDNATLDEYSGGIAIDGDNISITANTSAWFNSTLWQYNLSQPAFGDEVIRVETAANPGVAVDFAFTGVPSISEGEYRLNVDGNTIETFGSGGTVSWSYADWSSHNFSLRYRKIPKPPEEDSDSGFSGGSIPVSSFCRGEEGVADRYSWIAADTDRFTFDGVDPATGVRSVAVETNESLNEFRMCVTALRDRPNLTTLPADVYRFYEFSVEDSTDRIASTTVTFDVNRSFAQQYDTVVLSRYDEGWTDLPTTRANATGDVWTYETTADGFSYYAVHGVNEAPKTDEPGTTSEPTGSGDETVGQVNDTQPVNTTTRNDTSEGEVDDQGTILPESDSPNWPVILGIILTVIAVSGAGFIGYRRWIGSTSDVTQLYERIERLVNKNGIQHPDWVDRKLATVEQLLKQNRDEQAYALLKNVEQHLEND